MIDYAAKALWEKFATNDVGGVTMDFGEFKAALTEFVGTNKVIDESKITRVELINHATNRHPVGRLITMHQLLKDFTVCEISMQDGGRTMKVFFN